MSLLAGLRERRARGELSVDLESARARVAALEGVPATMWGSVGALVLDSEELGAPEPKAALARRVIQVPTGCDPADIAEETRRQHGEVMAFADRERAYLDDRDAELRRIIQVL